MLKALRRVPSRQVTRHVPKCKHPAYRSVHLVRFAPAGIGINAVD